MRPLPPRLADRYKNWHSGDFSRSKKLFGDLAANGQHPHSMVVSCCDSRVQPTSVFGAEGGELFVHRNIANLVPPASSEGLHHGTSAALEYAIGALKVRHIIVMGHSGCGGVENGYHLCKWKAEKNGSPPLGEATSLYRWLELLQPAYSRLEEQAGEANRIALMEKKSVLVSLENLLGFLFVRDAVKAGDLTLHGLWIDIASGNLLGYDADKDSFEPILG